MTARQQLVVCSLEPWDHIWRRNQYLVDNLLRHDQALEVLFVEPAADPFHAVTHGRRPHRGDGLRTLPGYEGRLSAFQPTKYGPRALGSAVQSAMQSQVLRAIGNLGWERPTLWINDPLWVSLLDQGWPSLYDVTDDWVHAERSSRVHERIVKADRALIDGVDAVVVCSPELLVRKGGTLVRNGVDVAAYRRPADRPADLPAGPNAVYVGTLHEDRLDVDLTLATAARLARMGASLVLVGPDALASETSQRLRAASGLLVLGGRPAEQVPGYLQHAEVLVVPHVVDAFTDSLDPVKLYEYLAIGRPIVSTPVAGFRDAETARGIEVVGAEQFPDAVANLLRDPRPTVVHEGIPEWTDRAAQMRAVIQGISVRVAL